MQRLPDEVVDSVTVAPGDTFAVVGHADRGDDPDRRVLEAFVTLSVPDAEFYLAGVEAGESRSTDGGGYTFREVTGQDGVVIEVGPGLCVLVSDDAFSRLMGRLRQALIARQKS